jgi:hypothetical protein
MKLETLAVHAGYSPEPTTKAVAVPIYQTTSYSFDSTQHGADLFDLKVAGNIYTRIMNPTQDVLEKRVAAMEGGIGGLALASGQAAITYAIMTIAEAGDNIVSASTLYGGTYNLFAHTLPQYGIEVRFANHADPASFRKADQRQDQGAVLRIGRQPAWQRHRLRATGRDSTPARRAFDRRQHGSLTLSVPPLRARRRHRRALADQVHRGSWQLDRRHDCRQRSFPVGRAQAEVQAPQRARRVLPWRRLYRSPRPGGFYRSRARGAAAQHGRSHLAVQQLPDSARPGDAAAAHGPHLHQQRKDRRLPAGLIRRWRGSITPACPTIQTTHWYRST